MKDCVNYLRSLNLLSEEELKMVSRTNQLKMIGCEL